MLKERPPPALRVVFAEPADSDRIAGLLLAAFRDFRPLYTPAGFDATTPPATEVSTRFPEGPVWIALEGESIVGTVSAVVRGTELFIRSMAVLPEARGRGVGKLLLDRAEAFASAHACRRLTLTTTPFLLAAIRLYERAGFRRTDGGPDDLHGTPLFAMVKELNPS